MITTSETPLEIWRSRAAINSDICCERGRVCAPETSFSRLSQRTRAQNAIAGNSRRKFSVVQRSVFSEEDESYSFVLKTEH
jgi:hypothetical protein